MIDNGHEIVERLAAPILIDFVGELLAVPVEPRGFGITTT
jgi:hypothetical protein